MDAEIVQLEQQIMSGVRSMPNIDPEMVKSLERDFKDIIILESCDGTKYIVMSKLKNLLFKLALLGGLKKQ